MKTGKIFVVSAPSGAGKTTLCKRVLKNNPNLSYSVSHTTRAPRNNEKHGVDYFFITKEAFEKGIQEKRWAEWAEVHGNFYGTSLGFIKENIASGASLLLDIDVQGAEQIKKNFPAAVTIFIMAPSVEVLEQRLISRGTDSEAVIQKRLINAEEEIARKGSYDHVIVNDDLERAVEELNSIVQVPGEAC
ncbi:MAG TPA: guanylate kinase [Desulfobacteraceae bacterium]|nr:guanylate kinase [Desulfobacteraceae bacterium]